MNTSWLAEIRVVTANGNTSKPTVPLYESKAQFRGGAYGRKFHGYTQRPSLRLSLGNLIFSILSSIVYFDYSSTWIIPAPPVIDLRYARPSYRVTIVKAHPSAVVFIGTIFFIDNQA